MNTNASFSLSRMGDFDIMQKTMVMPVDAWRQGLEFWFKSAEMQMDLTFRMLDAMNGWDVGLAATRSYVDSKPALKVSAKTPAPSATVTELKPSSTGVESAVAKAKAPARKTTARKAPVRKTAAKAAPAAATAEVAQPAAEPKAAPATPPAKAPAKAKTTRARKSPSKPPVDIPAEPAAATPAAEKPAAKPKTTRTRKAPAKAAAVKTTAAKTAPAKAAERKAVAAAETPAKKTTTTRRTTKVKAAE